MSKKIKIVMAHCQSLMCPTIIIGYTADGCTVYARYRFGHLSVRLDSRNPAPFNGAGGVWIMAKQLDSNGLASSISYDDLKKLTSKLIDWPDHITPRQKSESEDAWLIL